MTGRARDAAAALLLVVFAVALTSTPWRDGPPQWKPDALFYQAQVEEIRGLDRAAALSKVFSGPLAAPRRLSEAGDPVSELKVSSPVWVTYSSQFYRRRWAVPLAAAGLTPALGARALPTVSLLGYTLACLLIYVLLRLRFDRRISFGVAALVAILPAFRYWSAQPLSDSTGVAMLAASLIAAVLVVDRGVRWLPLWVAAVFGLAFTRDAALIAAAAAVWVAVRERSRTTLWLAASGLVASATTFLAFGAPYRQALAYTLGGFKIPRDTSVATIARAYPHGLSSVVKNDAHYLTAHPMTVVLVVAGLAGLLVGRRAYDPYVSLARATLVACFGYVALLPNYTAMRLELVFVPPLSIGIAYGAVAVLERLPRPNRLRGNVNTS